MAEAAAALDPAPSSTPAPPRTPRRRTARDLLTRRLADIVCLPASRVTPSERWIVADVLEELLRRAEPDLRRRVAIRLAEQSEAPPILLRRLACDSFEIAEPILEKSRSLTDFDMMEAARKGSLNHRIALANRETVSETLAAALAAMGEDPVVLALLANTGAVLAAQTVDHLAQMATRSPELARAVIKRNELRPAQAFALFWECAHPERRIILDRFAVTRSILQDAAADVFPMAADEEPADDFIGRALAYIDRRQRDRQANDASVYGGLEGVVETLGVRGATEPLLDEIARLAQIQRSLLDRMLDDFGGEPLAVLVKATGMSRAHLHMLARMPGRDAPELAVEHAELVYDTLSVDKAQTVLRYWDWSLGR